MVAKENYKHSNLSFFSRFKMHIIPRHGQSCRSQKASREDLVLLLLMLVVVVTKKE